MRTKEASPFGLNLVMRYKMVRWGEKNESVGPEYRRISNLSGVADRFQKIAVLATSNNIYQETKGTAG